jgi:DNA-binding IclR family transcriptional regulator
MHRAKSEYAIQTVTNALRLLEVFEADEEIGVTELARRLSLHKNNVFRLLATLAEKGWVEQSADTERYRLGRACVRLAGAFGRARALSRYARPVLERLARVTGETTHLGVLRGYDVVILDGVLASAPLVTGLHIGGHFLPHCIAAGKVLLACSAPGTLEAYDREVVAERGVEQATEATIVDRDKLFEHLRHVAAQGFALELEEFAPGVASAAAPVTDASDRVVAALAVSAPLFRVDRDGLESRIVPEVVAAAACLSRQLGAAP